MACPDPPGAGTETGPIPARPLVDSTVAGTTVIRVPGVLDSAGGARLLRLLDAQIEVARTGYRRLDAVVVDVSGLHSIGRGGPEALAHALYACARRRIDFAVAGHWDLMSASPAARRRLSGLRWFPTVDVAVTSLAAERASAVPPAGAPGTTTTVDP